MSRTSCCLLGILRRYCVSTWRPEVTCNRVRRSGDAMQRSWHVARRSGAAQRGVVRYLEKRDTASHDRHRERSSDQHELSVRHRVPPTNSDSVPHRPASQLDAQLPHRFPHRRRPFRQQQSFKHVLKQLAPSTAGGLTATRLLSAVPDAVLASDRTSRNCLSDRHVKLCAWCPLRQRGLVPEVARRVLRCHRGAANARTEQVGPWWFIGAGIGRCKFKSVISSRVLKFQ